MTELDLTPFRGQVDVLQGGVPCQAFSQAGVRKGLEDPRGQLILHFNKLILDCEPRMFVVENVRGLITHNKKQTLPSILELFANGGQYDVQYQLLNAADYGVPQKRERVFIVGVRKPTTAATANVRPFVYPAPSGVPVVLRDVLQNVPPSAGAKYPPKKADVMRLVPPGGCWINLPKEIQESYLGKKTMAAGGGKRGIARRLSMDAPSLTLTTSPAQKQTERCHPEETRPLTVREYARIQTFPDAYKFTGSLTDQYKQIGNAVPVQLAYAIAMQVKRYLAGYDMSFTTVAAPPPPLPPHYPTIELCSSDEEESETESDDESDFEIVGVEKMQL